MGCLKRKVVVLSDLGAAKWDPSTYLARTVSLGLWVSNEGTEGLADNQVRYHEPDPCRLQKCAGEL